MSKLIASLACRNASSRLYGKPLQNIDVKNNLSILEYMIKCIQLYNSVDQIVLAISESRENYAFIDIAKKYKLKYIIGDDYDVLSRLIKSCTEGQGTDVLRLTTESPFCYHEIIDSSWDIHKKYHYDFTALDNVPDGAGFEIISIKSLIKSWQKGQKKHRSELCSLYIRENISDFKVNFIDAPDEICRTDIRVTVDNPEDLILIRFIYKELANEKLLISLNEIIKLLDKNPNYKELVRDYIDQGLNSMYLK